MKIFLKNQVGNRSRTSFDVSALRHVPAHDSGTDLWSLNFLFFLDSGVVVWSLIFLFTEIFTEKIRIRVYPLRLLRREWINKQITDFRFAILIYFPIDYRLITVFIDWLSIDYRAKRTTIRWMSGWDRRWAGPYWARSHRPRWDMVSTVGIKYGGAVVDAEGTR